MKMMMMMFDDDKVSHSYNLNSDTSLQSMKPENLGHLRVQIPRTGGAVRCLFLGGMRSAFEDDPDAAIGACMQNKRIAQWLRTISCC